MKKIFIALFAFFVLALGYTGNSASFKYGGIKHDITGITAAGTTTTLTASSTQVQVASGSVAQTFKLPAATSLVSGYWYSFINDTATSTVTIQNAGTATIKSIAASSTATIYLGDNSTSNGKWYVAGQPTAAAGSVASMADLTSSFTETNFGTLATHKVVGHCVGNVIHLKGYFTAGTVAGATAKITPSATYPINTSILGTSNMRLGDFDRIQTGVVLNDGVIFYDGSTSTDLFYSLNGGSNTAYEKEDATTLAAAGTSMVYEVSYPTTGCN